MKITKREIELLRVMVYKELKEDADKFDLEAEIDRSLTYDENKELILDKIEALRGRPETSLMTRKELDQEIQQRERQDSSEGRLFHEQANYLIVGKKGSAKTSLGFTVMNTIHNTQKKKCYTYRFPNAKALKKIPFPVENIVSLNKLYHLRDAIVLIDEAHIHFSSMEKKVNEDLRNLLSISRQNNVDFVFICHNSYFLNRSLFSFIDVKMIKEVNPQHWELERVYMRKLYSNTHIFGKGNFFLDCDYERGNQTFEKPGWFTDEFSCAYRVNEKKESIFSKFLHQNAPKRTKVRRENERRN